jgi:hypothetical protein
VSSNKGRVLINLPDSSASRACPIFVVGRSFKRLERLKHLERMELAQRLFLRLGGEISEVIRILIYYRDAHVAEVVVFAEALFEWFSVSERTHSRSLRA